MYAENIPSTIELSNIKTPEDVIKAFEILQEKAKTFNSAICLDMFSSNPLKLQYNKDDSFKVNRITVDSHHSKGIRYCPRCGDPLYPSDVAGYENVCLSCDENFN